MLKRPILKYISLPNIEQLVKWYDENIDAFIDKVSKEAGEKVGLGNIGIQYHPTGHQAEMVLSFLSDNRDEFQEEKDMNKSLMELSKKMIPGLQAMMDNLVGGDPNCDHEFEQTESGLRCKHCNGTL